VCSKETSRLKLHTLRLHITYCFSTATMVARTHLIVILYIYCLSCCTLILTYMARQFNSRNGPVKAKFAYLYTNGCCRLRNTLLVKLCTLWDGRLHRSYGATTPSHLGRKLAGPLCNAFSSAFDPRGAPRQATWQPSGNEEGKWARNGRQIFPGNFHVISRGL